jgi:cellulose synthase/poly-beta-1,6-N-acetylglucosamine synthase-like glycosyltransferase/glycosyltransferase involved in cell wall biosynthesis/O-antigen/teichoic acid export membrane protein
MEIKKISIIIPLYNEAKNLPELILRLKKTLIKTGKEYELVFVDDNSTDETDKIFKKRKRDQKLILLKKKGEKGKAFSLIEGFSASNGDALVMIDGDLQYPPEAIPGMIKSMENADIVVANRKKYEDSIVRKVLSRAFRIGFGKFLFGLDHDIQSGLKSFRRDVIETISFNPSSAWTFDLEMLHIASHAGYVIKDYDIEFEKRKNGHSSVNVIKTAFDIGFNALKLRLKRIHPIVVKPKNAEDMLGAGIRYKKKLYVTHTTLSHQVSAMQTFTLLQKVIIAFFLFSVGIGFFLHPLFTLQAIVALLSFIYFIDVFFNLFVILKSLSLPQEIVSSDQELKAIEDKYLPIYSILCPLYREAHVIPQFINAINKLSWPKEKLDVILLLEEDDKESIESVEKMKLPSFVRTIVVPHSMPKTKPKACNYGLAFAKGQYLVIYDAEDIPEPMQLKKAFLGFKKVPDSTICLQAKLNYYNPHQNLLTRFFTAEYSLWFDVTLTGLQSINTTIPLGGTSNHFKIGSLRQIEGWDPFNVTEDADLGIRLFKRGYKTAIIDSVTLEEANSKYGNWIRQRSRWIKGYMQTYLVHIRETLSFAREQGIHSLIFQLIVGGKIAFVLINPLLWFATIAYFTLYAFVGPQIESLYPSVIFYMAVISLIFGNFLFLYYYMIGVAKKGQWTLMKFVFLIPIYWIMISAAALVALYQLIFKPHYWEKTVHGFHLATSKKIPAIAAGEIIYVAPFRWAFLPNKIKTKLRFALAKKHFSAGTLIFANAFASFLSFLSAAYLGRVLTLEDFALISFINGLASIVGIIFGSLGTTMIYKTGYLMGKFGEEAAIKFWVKIRKRAVIVSLTLSVLCLGISPFLIKFFNLSGPIPLVLFSFIILVNLAAAADRGLLFSKFNLNAISILTLVEPLGRFLLALLFVFLGLKYLAYTAIPIAAVLTFLLGWSFVIKNKKKIKNLAVDNEYNFPFKFFFVSLLSGLSAVIFLNLDVILAKHYLSSSDAGLYALSALIGKMIFFLGFLASPFFIPLLSKNEGANQDSKKFLNLTVLGTLMLTVPAFVSIVLFGHTIIPLLFGHKSVPALPFITLISFAMVCYSVSRVYTDYYLVKKHYIFPVAAFILGIFQLGLLQIFHSSVWSFVLVTSFIWITYFAITLTFHIFSSQVKIFENNAVDFLGLFVKGKKLSSEKNNKLRILILNWRDTKHKWAGGAEVYIQELAKNWTKEGNNVTIFCGSDRQHPNNETIDGVKIVRRGGFYTVYIWAFLYYMLKFRGKYDVIVDSENGIPFFTPLYTKIPKFLLIHHVHQEVFRKSLKWPFSSLALFLEAKLMPVVYRSTQVITVSPSSKEEILKHKLTKKEPLIIYNGVDTNIYKPGIKNKNPLILYVGRLQYYKSLHVLIVAAKKVLHEVPEAEFVIAGEGEEKANLIKFAEKLGISEKIKFLGKVTEAEKISLFQKAWVFVNPSFMEGWGITTIEANACGTPAIASNVPGLRDAVRDTKTGLLIRYGKYNGFGNTIINLIKDEKLRKKMSKESVNWANIFSWEKSSKDFFNFMFEYLEKNPVIKTHRIAYVFNRLMSLL